MKLKKCIVFFLFSCTFVQASDFYSNAKESAGERRGSVSVPLQTLTSQACQDMQRVRLHSQESQVNLDIANLIIQRRIERKESLKKCAEKLRVDRVDRGTLKYVCSKLPRHLENSSDDNKIYEKLIAIRKRFNDSISSLMYNINPIGGIWSDQKLRMEAVELTRLIMNALLLEAQNGSVEALAVEASSPNEQYDDQD